jgi:NAD+ synthase
LRLAPSILNLDFADIKKRIERFIKNYVYISGTKGIVLGLSGGIDSNTIAALAANAIGGENVLGLIMPEKETRKSEDIEDAQFVAKKFGLKTQICDITDPLEEICKSIPILEKEDKLCKGNVKARIRMLYLYCFANKLNKIVCGSSDKSETMMGYCTKHGDGAADIAPIMDLYKTQVRKLAKHIGIPSELISKQSTPALWPNQLAETELGFKYETLDLILFGLEHLIKTEEIARQLRIEESEVDKIKNRWLSAENKRRTPLTVKIEFRTIGIDFRLPYTLDNKK